MAHRPIVRCVIALVLAAGTLAACTEEQQQEIVDDTAEIAARNAAAAAGTAAFEREGLEVSDVLECTANSTGGAEDLRVTCTGVSDDGKELALEGSVSAQEEDINVDAIRGSFVGTVNGEEVFAEDCLGDGC